LSRSLTNHTPVTSMKYILLSLLAVFSMSILVGCPGGDGSGDSSTTEFDPDFQGVNGPLQGKLVYKNGSSSETLDLASGKHSSFLDPFIRQDAKVSMDESEIVSTDRDGGYIVLSKSDGQTISSFDVNYVTKQPKFSPDKQSIAALLDGEVILYSRDGEVLKSLPNDITAYDWTAEGRLVYASGGVIYQTDTDLSQPTQIGDAFSYHIHNLSVSPDGSRIAFSLFSLLPSSSTKGMTHTWIMNMDGSGLKQLTNSSEGYGEYQTAWSPDGQWVLVRQKINGDGEWQQTQGLNSDKNLFAVPADAENVDLTLINIALLKPPLESDVYDQDPPDSPAIAIQKYDGDGDYLHIAKADKGTLNWIPASSTLGPDN